MHSADRVNDSNEIELDSRQLQELEDSDDYEEEVEEMEDDEERGESSGKELENQEVQARWTWGPSFPSREWVLERGSFPASSLVSESEPPYASSHGTSEGTSLSPDGAAQMFSWSSTTLYGNIVSNPWMDDESEG